MAAPAQPGDEHLLALRGELGDGQIAEGLDAVAQRAPLDVGAGEVLAMLQPIALDDWATVTPRGSASRSSSCSTTNDGTGSRPRSGS